MSRLRKVKLKKHHHIGEIYCSGDVLLYLEDLHYGTHILCSKELDAFC